MSNEAAERLLELWMPSRDPARENFQQDFDDALVAERRATVERIKHTVLFQRNRLGKPPESIRVTDLIAILDEEAAR